MKNIPITEKTNLLRLEEMLLKNVADLCPRVVGNDVVVDRDVTTTEWNIIKVCVKLAQ